MPRRGERRAGRRGRASAPPETNAFSKLWDNHEAALALFFMAYNFVTIHGTLKTTPAMAHGLTDHPRTIEEMLGVLAEYA